jgi:hypothetical protein
MQPIQTNIMDPEEQAAFHATVLAENEVRERARVAARNRAAGHAKPCPGDRLYVMPAAGLRQRCRAGVLFLDRVKAEVVVLEDGVTPEPGTVGVPVHGAELILADDSLNVITKSETSAEAAALRTQVADRDAELAKLKAENARLLREARQRAPEDPSGGPGRLRAQREARSKLPSEDGFGGKE